MRKFVAAIGCAGLLASTSAQALFIDFETGLGGLTPTTSPTQGGLLKTPPSSMMRLFLCASRRAR